MLARLRVRHVRNVFANMPCAALFACLVLLAPAPSGVRTLPAGDDPVFRNRMMDWSQPPPKPLPSSPALSRALAVALPRLSSRFGYRTDPIRRGRAMHAGIDIPGRLSSAVRAAQAGTVQFAGVAGGYGNMVEIVHAGGLATRYGHLLRMLVRPGAWVAQGEVIALMGSTGRSTGSHLHFEVRRNGRAVDPLGLLGIPIERDEPAPAQTSEPYLSAFARARAAGGASTMDRRRVFGTPSSGDRKGLAMGRIGQ